MTLFNIWHYLVIAIAILSLMGIIYISFKQKTMQLQVTVFFSLLLIILLIGAIAMTLVDKYTKEVTLSKLESKRLLSIEKVAYSGIVTNVGDYEIGEVTFELKLVNQGHVIGNGRSTSFFNSVGLWDMIMGKGSNSESSANKTQSLEKEFIVAKNLKPGQSQSFRVYFAFPPHFSNVSQFTKVYAH